MTAKLIADLPEEKRKDVMAAIEYIGEIGAHLKRELANRKRPRHLRPV